MSPLRSILAAHKDHCSPIHMFILSPYCSVGMTVRDMMPPRFWPCVPADCCSTSERLDGYQTVDPRAMEPAGNRPGADSTVRPQAVEVY